MSKTGRPPSPKLQWQIFGLILCTSPILFLFSYYGQLARGLILYCVVGVFAIVVLNKKHLITTPPLVWTIGAIFLLHLGVILFARVPDYLIVRVAIYPATIIDMLFVNSIINMLEKYLNSKR